MVLIRDWNTKLNQLNLSKSCDHFLVWKELFFILLDSFRCAVNNIIIKNALNLSFK